MQNEVTLPELLPVISNGLNKRQINNLVAQSVAAVLEAGNAVQTAEALAVMEVFVKSVRKDERFMNAMQDELLKAHGTLKTASGARIEACEAGIAHDYSENPSWRHLNNQIAELTEQKKSLEEKLRRIPGGRLIVDEETGEVFAGALKTSKSTYRITLSR